MYKTGLRPSPPDDRDYPVSALLSVESKFEEKFDLPDFDKIPVLDQGQVNSCYAHAMRTAREYVEMKQTGTYQALSEGSVYGNRVQGDYMGEGLIPRLTNQRVQDRGICKHEIYPENVEVPEAVEIYNQRFTQIIIDGKPRRITSYARPRSDDEIKSCLKLGYPVTLGVPIYQEFYQLNKDNSVMTTQPKGSNLGYHGMVIYGWDDSKGWHIRNSWGTEWGDNGDCWIPYNFEITEAWLLVDKLTPVQSQKYNRTIKKIIVHHMGDGKGTDISITARWNPFGYQYPSYDWGIEGNGKVIQGRPLSVIGAHAIATYKKYTSGECAENNWFNKYSIGVALAGDFTTTSMPKAMFDSLVNLLEKLIKDYNLTINDVLPHREITATACPGDQWGWSWSSLIKELEARLEVDEVLNDLVIYADGDTGTALILSQDLGCPMVHKKDADKYQAKNKHWIGVQGTNGNGNYYYAGANRRETAKKVLL